MNTHCDVDGVGVAVARAADRVVSRLHVRNDVEQISQGDVQRGERVGDQVSHRSTGSFNLNFVGHVFISGGENIDQPLALGGVHHVGHELLQDANARNALEIEVLGEDITDGARGGEGVLEVGD